MRGSDRPSGGPTNGQGTLPLTLKTAVAGIAPFGGGADTGPNLAGMWPQTVEQHLIRGSSSIDARTVRDLAKSAPFASLLPLGTPRVSVGGDCRPE